MNIEQLPDEGYFEYAHRLTDAVNDGVLNWQEWSDKLLGAGVYSGDSSRKNGAFFKKFLEKCDDDYKFSVEKCDCKAENTDLVLERKKMQDANRELQSTYRALARSDLLNDRIVSAIQKLPKFELNTELFEESQSDNIGLLLVSDIHAGANYKITGLYGEPVNEYNPDIMEYRFKEILRDVSKYQFSPYRKLIVGCLGDILENILRTSSLTKLTEPVVDTLISFSELYANWLVELSNIVKCPIECVIVGGNHDNLRFLSSKPQFDKENFSKLFREYVYLRLKDISEIEVRKYADFDVVDIFGQNVGFCHGNEKDIERAMTYYSNLYNTDIDLLYCGHFHSTSSSTNGISLLGDKECIRIGSLCGIDDYAKKLMKASRPSAYFALFNEEYGKTWEKKIYLV